MFFKDTTPVYNSFWNNDLSARQSLMWALQFLRVPFEKEFILKTLDEEPESLNPRDFQAVLVISSYYICLFETLLLIRMTNQKKKSFRRKDILSDRLKSIELLGFSKTVLLVSTMRTATGKTVNIFCILTL